MSTGEIFVNPTVQQVFFEIRFPNLFFIESKIGEFQLQIMEKFPISQLIHSQNLLFANIQAANPQAQPAAPDQGSLPQIEKNWRFQTEDASTTLNISTSSLHITSSKYKTYNNEGATEKFRDILQYAINPFLKITSLPKLLRVGLRYIDLCPFPGYSTEQFLSYYNSAYPTRRFSIEETSVFDFATIIVRGDQKLRYAESLSIENNKPKFTMDFDGSAEMITSTEWLNTTDSLYQLIATEYKKTILEPVKQIMRTNPQAEK